MKLVPMTVKLAKRFIAQWHRHLPELHGGLFAVGIWADGEGVVAVGVVGNPPPTWQGTGRCVISRCATSGYEHACSMVYGALCRAAKALGYQEVWTYTLASEPGTSLRAAGFEHMGWTSSDASWDREARPRKAPVQPGAKQRWRRKLGNL